VATSLFGPRDWDYGGGHALLRAVGATLVDQHGRELVYAEDGTSRTELAFAGHAEVVEVMWRRALAVRGDVEMGSREADCAAARRDHRGPGAALAGPGMSLGGRLPATAWEGSSSSRARTTLRPVTPMVRVGSTTGETWGLVAGQPTDDSEMALALARSLVHEGRYESGGCDGCVPRVAGQRAVRRGEHDPPRSVRPSGWRQPGQRIVDAREPPRRGSAIRCPSGSWPTSRVATASSPIPTLRVATRWLRFLVAGRTRPAARRRSSPGL
jgi:hypothetical protein